MFSEKFREIFRISKSFAEFQRALVFLVSFDEFRMIFESFGVFSESLRGFRRVLVSFESFESFASFGEYRRVLEKFE